MAKPANAPDIWASDDIYNQGPKSGLPTKTNVLQIVAAAAQGHIPGNLNPTTANEFNRWCFEVSEECVWVFDGTFLADLTAHIVETDGTGKARISTAIIGGTLTSGPSLVVNESNTGTGPSLRVNAVDDPAVEINTVIQDIGIYVRQLSGTSDSDRSSTVGSSYLWNFLSDPRTTNAGPGGLEVRTEGTSEDTAGKPWASISGFNQVGIAGIFSAFSFPPYGALHADSLSQEGVALKVGYLSPGAGMIGIDARGGQGNATNNVKGGVAGFFAGGLGVDGVNDVDGGTGIIATGGGSGMSGTGGSGGNIKSGGLGAPALVLEHTQSVNQFAPLLFGVSGDNIGGGVHMAILGSGFGAQFESQAGDGLRLMKSETASFLMGTHYYMQPIINKIVNVTLSDGDFWLTRSNVSPNDYFQLRAFADGERFIPMFTEEVVYAHGEKLADTSSGTVGVSVGALTVPLSPEMAPTASDANVIIRVSGHAWGTVFSGVIVDAMEVVITDDGSGGGEILTYELDLLDSSARHQFAIEFEYTIPGAGARDFTIGVRKKSAGLTLALIGRLFVEIHTKWDQ